VPSAPSAGPFLVTTDGFLGLVPFEALDAGEGSEYVPLLMRRDVAYLRYADATAGTPRALPGVILADVEPSKRLLRRYPFQPELEEAVAEGEAAAALFPDARFLTGDSASKANLTSTWENASFVYIAAHVLRDPQVPYLMLIPLASPGESAGPDAAYLDVTDIRAADLSNCRVVILSGCSSGAPYLESRIAGPSLGDAFLDSGAGAVVHTFWDIGDVEARKLMTSFMQTWSGPHGSDIRTLCDVRRAAYLSSKKEAGKPFGWASYAIEIGRL
jgi:CHAT domain-containing protein